MTKSHLRVALVVWTLSTARSLRNSARTGCWQNDITPSDAICRSVTFSLTLDYVADPLDPDADCVRNDLGDDNCPSVRGLTDNGCPGGPVTAPS
jgi:hypothetical protein